MKNIKSVWWKVLAVALMVYTFIGGVLLDVPHLPQLQESIRNLYFHVCMWFSMMIFFIISVSYALLYLKKNEIKYDIYSRQFAAVGIIYGLLGYATGIIWMSYTWADPNNASFVSSSAVWREPKLIGTALALLIYLAYLVLRDSVENTEKKARLAAVYNLFAFAFLFPTIWILPRLLPSLHPGQEGNPALNTNDIDAQMRLVFYPAVAGWTLLGGWIVTLKVKLVNLKTKINEQVEYT